MPMSQSTLSDQLQSLVPTDSDIEAIDRLANAYATYCLDAEASRVPPVQISSASVELAKTAMKAALVGLNNPGQGSQKIVDGFKAFWSSIALNPALSFPGSVAVIAQPFVNTKLSLDNQFIVNRDGSLTTVQALDNISVIIDFETKIGGSVLFPTDPGPAGPFPII